MNPNSERPIHGNNEVAGKEESSESTKTHSKDEKEMEERNKIKITESSSMRKQISFAIYSLKVNQTITISAFGINVEKAVRMAEIVKLRIGMLHQETNLMINR